MKSLRNLLGLLILTFSLLSSCENQIDFQHENARINKQLKWEKDQRVALQRYIDFVLNARYEANAYGTGSRKAWKIKDPITSDDLLLILRGNMQQVHLPESMEIIELESLSPVPPKAEEMPGGQIVEPLADIFIDDDQPDSSFSGLPFDTTSAFSQDAPVGDLSNLEGAPAAQRVGVSRGLPVNNSPQARTVVPAPGISATAGDVLMVMEQRPVSIPLEEALLFSSGSSRISDDGKQVITALAKKLRDYPNHMILIEGHADGKEVSNLGDIKDNWDLSVMRATEVVRALVRAGIPSQNLIAAGRGKSHPLETNDTAAGRSANRRVEVVLTPWPKP